MKKYVNGQYVEYNEAEMEAMQVENARYELMEKSRPLTAEEVNRMVIAQQINTLTVDDNTALRMVEFYPEWATDTAYTAGYKVQYGGTHHRLAGSQKMRSRCGRKSARRTTARSTIQSRTAEIWRWNPVNITSRTM